MFAILIVELWDAMRVTLNREQPEDVSAVQLTKIKLSIVKVICSATTILLNPVYGLVQNIAHNVLPHKPAMSPAY